MSNNPKKNKTNPMNSYFLHLRVIPLGETDENKEIKTVTSIF